MTLSEKNFNQVKKYLENERHQIDEEIKNYPVPIAACDAQFNHLLEERAKISQELDRLEKSCKENFAG